MRRILTSLLLIALLTVGFGITPTHARTTSTATTTAAGVCDQGVLPSGALSMICIPTTWNGNLVLFAHGYIAFNAPLDFQHLTLPDGTYIPDLIQNLGYAFATTSYRRNGLAILEGVDDIRELVEAFRTAHGIPTKSYLVGMSEGGIITALFAERHPDLISGGLAGCGPVGNFRGQLNYWGDFRVLFDYFYPNVIPGSPINIPTEVIDNWGNVYSPAVSSALAANPAAAEQLIATAHAATDPNDSSTIEATAQTLLWYNAFATNDGTQQLGGNPFGNRYRRYRGSLNDTALNQNVLRFQADAAALTGMKPYETAGNPTIPIVVTHTTGDPLIPFNQAVQYARKLTSTSRSKVSFVPIKAYGHCNFTTNQILTSFALLVLKTTGTAPANLPAPVQAVDIRTWDRK